MMGQELDLAQFTVAGLAHRCRQETERYYRRLSSNGRYCFELFYRAIAHRDEQAWDLIVKQYTVQVAAWIARHEAFSEVDEQCDYFVNSAFARFWQAFDREPEKLARFDCLEALLQYLKLCAHSAVKEYVERGMNPWPSVTDDLDVADASDMAATVDAGLKADRLWQEVLKIAESDRERVIAEAYFIYDMKPKEIFAWCKGTFKDVAEVRRIKDNFLARLRRNKDLLAILKNNA